MNIKRIVSLALICVMLLSCGVVFAEESEAVKIELNKFVYAPHEKMEVKISGLSQEQIDGGAVAQICEWRFGHQISGTTVKISELEDGVWTPIAPFEVRAFEVRVYTEESYSDETFLGKELFIIRGTPTFEVVNGTNGISKWAVEEVQSAIFDKLTTDKVLMDFQKDITREEFCEIVVNMYENATKTVAEPAPAETFGDTSNESILKAYNLGIVKGVGEGKFDCDAAITRQEIATMLFRAVKVIAPEGDFTVADPNAFGDSNMVDEWAKEGVDYFASKDIIKGDGTNFLPLDNCSCEEAIVLVKRIYDVYSK